MRSEAPSFQFEPDPELLSQLPNSLVLLHGNSNAELADKISGLLRSSTDNPVGKPFADGETNTHIRQNLRRRDVAIIQSTSAPKATEYFMEIAMIADAAKRAASGKITAVIPYYGWGRQDRKDRPRVPISASLVSDMLVTAGVDSFITVDLHAPQTQMSVRLPWDNVPATPVLLPTIENFPCDELTIVSPDLGGSTRASGYARVIGTNFATIQKERDYDVKNESRAIGINGDIEGRDCVIVDDMIDTAGSVIHASELLLKNGARSVRVVATHGVFSAQAIANLSDSDIEKIVVTDTIRQNSKVRRSPKFHIVSVAPIIAHAIYSNQTGGSISEKLF